MLTVIPASELSGCVDSLGSKPWLQRAVVLALLARGTTRIRDYRACAETDLLVRLTAQLGAVTSVEGSDLLIEGTNGRLQLPREPLDCQESGFAFRVMLAVCALIDDETRIIGGPGLAQRPMDELAELLVQQGATVSLQRSHEGIVASVTGGRLAGGPVLVPTTFTSQFISALLLVAPFAMAPMSLEFDMAGSAANYSRLTASILGEFRGKVSIVGPPSAVRVAPSELVGGTFDVSPDATATFQLIVAAALIPSKIRIFGSWHRADSLVRRALLVGEQIGVGARIVGRTLNIETMRRPDELVEIDVGQVPTFTPALAAASASLPSGLRVTGASRVRFHKTNRLSNAIEQLGKLGYNLKALRQSDGAPEGFATAGRRRWVSTNAPCGSSTDHRIVMAVTLGAMAGSTPATVFDERIVDNGYPRFVDDLRLLGACIR